MRFCINTKCAVSAESLHIANKFICPNLEWKLVEVNIHWTPKCSLPKSTRYRILTPKEREVNGKFSKSWNDTVALLMVDKTSLSKYVNSLPEKCL